MDYAQTSLGTPFFLSPEICQGEKYNFKTDIWMLGCVMYELCSLKKPFTADNLVILMKNIVSEEVPSLPTHYSSEMRKIVSFLMKKDQNERPFIGEIMEMDIVQEKMKELGIIEIESPKVNKQKSDYGSNPFGLQLIDISSSSNQKSQEHINSLESDPNILNCNQSSSKEGLLSNQNLGMPKGLVCSDSVGNMNKDKGIVSISTPNINECQNPNERMRKKIRIPEKINKKYDSMGQGAFGKVMEEMNLCGLETTINK